MPILAKLKAFLDADKTPYEILAHRPAFTAQEVAAAQHVPPQELAKVVIVRTRDRFVMAVLPAPRRVDLHRLAEVLPEGRVRLATEQEFVQLFPHCEVGAMPPFGNLFGLPVYVDRSLEDDEEIVFPAGTHTETVRMKYADFVHLVQPVIGNFSLLREDV